MSLINKFADKVFDITTNISDRVGQQLTSLKQQGIKLPTFENFLKEPSAPPSKTAQNNQVLNRLAMNVAVQNVPGMPLKPVSNVGDGERQFKTVGGVWGRDKETGTVDFYRDGIDPAQTEVFDEEYYLPDSQKSPLAANGKYIRLNPNGDLNSSPAFKDKARPENASQFDWQGFEWVDASQVPAEYLSGDGKVAFENPKLAENQLNAFKRFVVDNNVVATWDEAKFQDVFAAKAGTSVKLELEPVGESNGKAVFKVTMNEASRKEFRAAIKEYRAVVEKDIQGGVKGQQESTNMAFDIPKVYVRAAIKTVQDTANTVLEIADPSIQTDPHNLTRARIGDILDSQLPPPRNGAREHALPRVDADPVMPDYNSDLFNRDITGKVNKDGFTLGKAAETAVELAAPVAVGKVAIPVKAVQGLSLPKPTIIGVEAEKQAAILLNQAKNSESAITSALTRAAKQNGGEMVGLENRLKSAESLTRKIKNETIEEVEILVKEGTGRNNAIVSEMPKVAEKINDTVRYTTTFSKQEYKTGIEKTLGALEEQGYKVEKFKDSWSLRGTRVERVQRSERNAQRRERTAV